RAIFRREIDRLAAAQRRAVTRGLHAGIVGIETPPGGQANRIVCVDRVDRRNELHYTERRPGADQGILPESAVKIHFAGMRFIVTRPLYTLQLFQTAIAHARVHGAEPADFVPDSLRLRRSPIMAEAPG